MTAFSTISVTKTTHYHPPITAMPPIHKSVVSVLKIVLVLLFVLALQSAHLWLAALCIGFFFIDTIDGVRLVPMSEEKDQYWQFVDSLVDRVVDSIIIAAFAFFSFVPWGVSTILLVSTYLTNYTKTKFECLFPDEDVPDGLIERNERMIGMVLSLLMYSISPQRYGQFTIIEIIFFLMITLSVITVSKRVVDVYYLIKQTT